MTELSSSTDSASLSDMSPISLRLDKRGRQRGDRGHSESGLSQASEQVASKCGRLERSCECRTDLRTDGDALGATHLTLPKFSSGPFQARELRSSRLFLSTALRQELNDDLRYVAAYRDVAQERRNRGDSNPETTERPVKKGRVHSRTKSARRFPPTNYPRVRVRAFQMKKTFAFQEREMILYISYENGIKFRILPDSVPARNFIPSLTISSHGSLSQLRNCLGNISRANTMPNFATTI